MFNIFVDGSTNLLHGHQSTENPAGVWCKRWNPSLQNGRTLVRSLLYLQLKILFGIVFMTIQLGLLILLWAQINQAVI